MLYYRQTDDRGGVDMKTYKTHIARKSILFFLLFLTVFSVAVSVIGYRAVTRVLLNEAMDDGMRIADAASREIDPDALDAYLEADGIGDDYWFTWNRLDHLCNAAGATFVYVIRPDEAFDHVTYFFSTVDHDSDYFPYDAGTVKDVIYEENRTRYKRLMAGASSLEGVVMDSRSFARALHHITVMSALTGSDGQVKGILCVQLQMDQMAQMRRQYVRKVLLLTILLAVVFLIVNSVYQRQTLLRPLAQITREASRFAAENTMTDRKLADSIRSRDEIGLLATSIDQMEDRITRYVEDMTRITAERERNITELSLAARIQESMLPSRFPAFPDRTEFDLYASMDPARAVGGDFYDFFLIDDDHLCLEIADVSGKGIPAALFMMASKIILANTAKSGRSPAGILKETNDVISENNPEGVFVTVWLGILELSTGRLIAANAGHEYPALKEPDGGYALYKDRHGFVIGAMKGMKYVDYELLLRPGSKLFVYTDGVVEATDADQNMFGPANMLAALNAQPDASPERTLRNVRAAVDGFVKDTEQFDDLTMLCLEYKGPGDAAQKA